MNRKQLALLKDIQTRTEDLSNGLNSDGIFDACDRASLNKIMELQDELLASTQRHAINTPPV